jgi:hypothetical protein
VDRIAMLNAEVKPLGCTPSQRKKDFMKVNIRARQSINLQLKSKGGPGIAGIFLNMGVYFLYKCIKLRTT